MKKKSKNPDHPFVILRSENNLTQADLAEILDVDAKYISLVECGKRSVSLKLAEKINKLYPYRIDWLLGKSQFKTDAEMAEVFQQKAMAFDSPLEFEKAWHRGGGGVHPVKSLIVAEARIAVALERMNESGWIVAVDMIESMAKVSAFQSDSNRRDPTNRPHTNLVAEHKANGQVVYREEGEQK